MLRIKNLKFDLNSRKYFILSLFKDTENDKMQQNILRKEKKQHLG